MASTAWGSAFGVAAAMELYEDVLVPRLFTPWARLLLDELELRRGEAVLDVACGPGSATRLAAVEVGPDGRVTGCDLSPAMLAIARGKPSLDGGAPIDFHEAPADALPVPDAAYDVATCQQGLQFFPDRPAALAEIRRALRPGGRVGIAVWAAIEQCGPFAALAAAIRDVGGDELADRYRDGPWGLASGERMCRLLQDAGFGSVRVVHRTLPVVFDGGPAQVASTLPGSGVAAELAELSQDELRAAIERRLAPLTVDGAVRSETASHLAFAVRE